MSKNNVISLSHPLAYIYVLWVIVVQNVFMNSAQFPTIKISTTQLSSIDAIWVKRAEIVSPTIDTIMDGDLDS